jgi:hypothetical protein
MSMIGYNPAEMTHYVYIGDQDIKMNKWEAGDEDRAGAANGAKKWSPRRTLAVVFIVSGLFWVGLAVLIRLLF